MTWVFPWINRRNAVSQFRMTDRDQEILQALSICVRLFSQTQIADHWFDGDKANTRRRLRQLKEQNLIIGIMVRARTLPDLIKPVITWRPGDGTPDFGKASYTLRGRWTGRSVRTVSTYIAAQRATHMYGGRGCGELKKPGQAGHDLGVSQVWLQMANSSPEWAEAWRGEDVMAHTRRGEKLPDGFVVNSNSEVVCVMEFGGSYDHQRVKAFHEDCCVRDLPYQMW